VIFPAYNPDPSSSRVTIDLVLIGCIVLSMALCIFCVLLIRFFLTPKFDKKFSSALRMLYGMKPLSRSFLYAIKVSSPIGFDRKKAPHNKIFDNYDFKSQASKFERVVSYTCIISLYFFILLILLFAIHYLGYCIEFWVK
jgi:hypothetical protein